jgi:hypothetical protein
MNKESKRSIGYYRYVLLTITVVNSRCVWFSTLLTLSTHWMLSQKRVVRPGVSHYKKQELLTFANTWFHPRFFGGVRVAHLLLVVCVVLLCVFMFSVSCCDVCYDFRIRCSIRRYLQLFVGGLIYVIYVCLPLVVSNAYCVVFFFVLCTVCCHSFSVFSNVSLYSLMFIWYPHVRFYYHWVDTTVGDY